MPKVNIIAYTKPNINVKHSIELNFRPIFIHLLKNNFIVFFRGNSKNLS